MTDRPLFVSDDPMNPGAQVNARVDTQISGLEKKITARAGSIALARDDAAKLLTDSANPLEVKGASCPEILSFPPSPAVFSVPWSNNPATVRGMLNHFPDTYAAPSDATAGTLAAVRGRRFDKHLQASHVDFLMSSKAWMMCGARFAFDAGELHGTATRESYELRKAKEARDYREKKREWARAISYAVMVQRSDTLAVGMAAALANTPRRSQ